MTPLAWTYLTYLAVTTGLTIWVARTLRHSGTVVLVGSDAPNPIAEALSHLLVIGFYLVNFGIIAFAMKSPDTVRDAQTSIELLSSKVGMILVTLGSMHFLLLLMFLTARRNTEREATERSRRQTLEELRIARQQASEPRFEN